jgi:Tol biopolymer transport system component
MILVSLWILTACTTLSPTSPASNLSTTMTPSKATALTLTSTPAITHTLEAETPALSAANYLLFYTDGVRLYTGPPLSILNRPELQSLYADINQSEGFVPYLLNNLVPQMSPNKTYLVIPGPDTTWLLNLAQGSTQPLVDKPVAVTWQSAGDYLAYTDDNALYILELISTPASLEIRFQRPESLSFASWSPDGNWIAVVEQTGEGGPDAYLV